MRRGKEQTRRSDQVAQIRATAEILGDLLRGTEATHRHKVVKRVGHLRLVVVVLVHIGLLRVKDLRQLLVRVRLDGERRIDGKHL